MQPQSLAPQKQATSLGTRSCNAQPGRGCSVPTPARSGGDPRSSTTKPNAARAYRPCPGSGEERAFFPS